MRLGWILTVTLSVALVTGCGDSPQAKAVKRQLDTLSRGDPDERIGAAAALGRMKATNAVPGLIRAIDDVRPDVSRAAVEALVGIGDPRASGAFRRQLKASEWRIRQLSAQGLGDARSPDSVPSLILAVRDTHAAVAAAAAAALVSCGGMDDLKGIACSTNETLSAREAALLVLGDSGSEGLEAVRQAVQDTNEAVRVAAYAALIKTGKSAEVPLLLAGLFDPATSVRKVTQKAILAMEPDIVLPALTELLEKGTLAQQTAVLKMLEDDRTARGVWVLATALVSERPTVRASAQTILGARRKAFARQNPDVRLLPAEPMLKALSSTNEAVRTVAMSLLETDVVVNRSIEPVLRKGLKDPSPKVRAVSARIFAQIGAEGVAETLTPLLGDGDIAVRRTAAVALLPMTNQAAVDIVVGELEEALSDLAASKSEKVAQGLSGRIAELIRSLTVTRSRKPVPALRRALEGGDLAGKTAAVKALGEIGDKTLYDAVSPMLSHNTWGEQELRAAAMEAMAKLDPARAVNDLLPILAQREKWQAESNVCTLCRVLSRLKEARAAEAMIDRLQERYENETGKMNEVKLAAAAGLVELGEHAVPALVRRLSDTKIRAGALALILGRIGEPAVSELAKAIKSDDAVVRKNAAWALGYLKQKPEIVESLSALLADGDAEVRSAAAWSLGQMQARQAVAALIRMLESEQTKDRLSAVESIGRIGDKAGVQPLILRLKDEDAEVRYAVSSALGGIGDKAAVDALRQTAAGDKDGRVRFAAGEALVALGVNESASGK